MTADPPDGGSWAPTRSMSQPAGPAPGEPASPDPPSQLQPGDVLAERFVVIRFLARGGMGEVYEVLDRHLQNKNCALKTLRPEIADDPVVRARFEREVLLAREIIHPNVCTTYDLFRVEGPRGPILFLTMKLLRGESLAARLRRTGRLAPQDALPLIRQMADALDAAHRAGIVHRDFKPGNIMLEGSGAETRVSVTDFGLSRTSESDATLALTGHIPGTPGYIAPEILHGLPASPAADVFAFSVVLHEMLTGRKPMKQAGAAAYTPPSKLESGLPREWDRVILGGLEPDPARRFQSAGEALAALDPFHHAPRPLLSRRRLLAAGLIVAALAGAIAAAWPRVEQILHPLPSRRFVALMLWPPEPGSANQVLLRGVLDAIAGRLVRAEASDKNFLVISPGDVSGQAPLRAPAEAASSLGANLVLAAALHPAAGGVVLDLDVVDALSGKDLRRRSITSSVSELNRLGEKAALSAAGLLEVTLPAASIRDPDELANLSPAAFQLFMSAEALVSQPNDRGLDPAIAAYQSALEAAPRFALGYARLSMAYTRKFLKTADRALLNLAARNADLALRDNPDSAKALLSRALVDVNSGDTQQAIGRLNQARRLDPADPQIPLYQARALRDLGRRGEEEAVYRAILAERPNYWPAYNELGWIQYRRGDYEKAAETFAEASAVAPQVAVLLTNQGTMNLLLGRKKEANDAFLRSLQRAPNETAYLNLGALAFEAGEYRKALDYYSKARDLRPNNDKTWRNLGDCYALLGEPSRVTASYAKAAQLLSDALRVNPRRGPDWMDLAFYQAKLGRRTEAETDLKNAESRNATDLYSQFKKAQVLALLGRKEEALRLVLDCMDRGLSPVDVDLALDLKQIRADPRFLRHEQEANARRKN